MRKVYLSLLLISLIAVVGCRTPKTITQEKEVIRIEKEVLRDTIIDVQIKEMYIDRQVKDTLSELRTNNAFSRAWWSNGMLYHSLEQKGVQPTEIFYRDIFRTDTIKTTNTEIKEVEKNLNWWQTLFIWSGGILFVMVVGALLFFCIKFFLFKR